MCTHILKNIKNVTSLFLLLFFVKTSTRRLNDKISFFFIVYILFTSPFSWKLSPSNNFLFFFIKFFFHVIPGTGNTSTDGTYKPSFLTDQELKHLILEAADGFLFVVSCDTGRIIYVSDSVTPVLNHTQNDWYGSSMYDNIHPEDIDKVREQLSTQEPQNTGRILDLKTGTVKKEGHQCNYYFSSQFFQIHYNFFHYFPASMRLCLGARRGFICRMKVGNVSAESMVAGHLNRLKQRNSLGPSNNGTNFAVVHCTGYIKNWPPTGSTYDNLLILLINATIFSSLFHNNQIYSLAINMIDKTMKICTLTVA